MEHEKVVHETIHRLNRNIDDLKEEQAKGMIKKIAEALIVFMIGTEPRLANPDLSPDEKIELLMSCLKDLALEFAAAKWGINREKKMKKFEEKFSKFRELDEVFTLLTK